MKTKNIIILGECLALLLFAIYGNWKFEVIAVHPFYGADKHDLKVMTWNVHCSKWTDSTKQRKIAELILDVDADFVQLNEYNQDSCLVMDSLLRMRYSFTEEYQSHRFCGDIYYSKREMANSGHVWIPICGKSIQTIKATIAASNDSVQIFGVHFASNRYDGTTLVKELESDSTSYEKYKDAQEKRCFQAHWTKEAAMKSKHPVIVMGDMNDFSFSAPLDTLTSFGLIDSWMEGGNGYGCTFHDGWMRLRIDHILHSKELKLESIKVIDTNLSDHNPVVAGFSLRKK